MTIQFKGYLFIMEHKRHAMDLLEGDGILVMEDEHLPNWEFYVADGCLVLPSAVFDELDEPGRLDFEFSLN